MHKPAHVVGPGTIYQYVEAWPQLNHDFTRCRNVFSFKSKLAAILSPACVMVHTSYVRHSRQFACTWHLHPRPKMSKSIFASWGSRAFILLTGRILTRSNVFSPKLCFTAWAHLILQSPSPTGAPAPKSNFCNGGGGVTELKSFQVQLLLLQNLSPTVAPKPKSNYCRRGGGLTGPNLFKVLQSPSLSGAPEPKFNFCKWREGLFPHHQTTTAQHMRMDIVLRRVY